MKLKTLAIAVAAASISVSASAADLKFGGDFHVGYKSEGNTQVEDFGSEIWFDVSEKVGGLTYFAHAELELEGGVHGVSNSIDTDVELSDGSEVEVELEERNDIEVDEVQVGVSGDFGKLVVGDTDNACDKLESGGDWNEFLAAKDGRGDCGSDDAGTILYTKKINKAEFGISRNMDANQNSIAMKYKHSKNLSVSIGHVQNDGSADNVTSASITAKAGKFALKARVNNSESDGEEDVDMDESGYSVFLAYQPTKRDNFNMGSDSDDRISVGYNRVLYKGSKLFLEVLSEKENVRGDREDPQYAIGVQYKF